MKKMFPAIAEELTAPAVMPEDYTGEDGLLYCGKCRTPKQAFFPEGKTLWGADRHPTECNCQKAERIEREAIEKEQQHRKTVADLKKHCFGEDRTNNWTFANDNGKTPQMGYAHLYAENWEKMRDENIGYLIWGRHDSGKSYLAACIANALMEQEVSVCMKDMKFIVNALEERFDGRNDYVASLCRYPLLIIDDLGAERNTEAAQAHVFSVIDSRYRSRKPLIVTTNLHLDQLQNPTDMAHARIYSRILEMCVPILCTGEQNRKETAKKKMETVQVLMNR
ncbi:MAG: ATP-binding protein [Oscillospiraceae bacterium]|nr:ATP-binding protein [Oscillospiraceae bacterium]